MGVQHSPLPNIFLELIHVAKYVCNKCYELVDDKDVIIYFRNCESELSGMAYAFCSRKCMNQAMKWTGSKFKNIIEDKVKK